MGLGFTFALVLTGFSVRLLGAGTILSGYVNGVNGIAVPFFNSNPMVAVDDPAGRRFSMGFILAAIQKIMAGKEASKCLLHYLPLWLDRYSHRSLSRRF